MITLKNKRIVLREFENSDFEAVHSYSSNPETVRYVKWGPNTEEDTERFIDRAIDNKLQVPRTNYDFAITTNNLLIGGCNLVVTGEQGWVGYCLHPDYWGKGFATEAVLTLLAFSFNTLNLHRVFAMCDAENIGSWKVLEKCGMRREGHFIKNQFQKGSYRDSYYYAVLSSEQRPQK